MAMTKSTGETKGKEGAAASRKAAPKAKSAAAKKAAPKKAAAPKQAGPKAKGAAAKKAAAPKLSSAQESLLQAVAGAGEAGYLAAKKGEQKTIDVLMKHKLVKKGKKDAKTKSFHVLLSQAGKKLLDSRSAEVPKAPEQG